MVLEVTLTEEIFAAQFTSIGSPPLMVTLVVLLEGCQALVGLRALLALMYLRRWVVVVHVLIESGAVGEGEATLVTPVPVEGSIVGGQVLLEVPLLVERLATI